MTRSDLGVAKTVLECLLSKHSMVSVLPILIAQVRTMCPMNKPNSVKVYDQIMAYLLKTQKRSYLVKLGEAKRVRIQLDNWSKILASWIRYIAIICFVLCANEMELSVIRGPWVANMTYFVRTSTFVCYQLLPTSNYRSRQHCLTDRCISLSKALAPNIAAYLLCQVNNAKELSSNLFQTSEKLRLMWLELYTSPALSTGTCYLAATITHKPPSMIPWGTHWPSAQVLANATMLTAWNAALGARTRRCLIWTKLWPFWGTPDSETQIARFPDRSLAAVTSRWQSMASSQVRPASTQTRGVACAATTQGPSASLSAPLMLTRWKTRFRREKANWWRHVANPTTAFLDAAFECWTSRWI